MEIGGIISGIFVGLIIGAMARIVVRNNAPVGCLLTMLIGVVGAGLGLALGAWAGWGFWATFAAQVVIAAIIVMIFTALARPRA